MVIGKPLVECVEGLLRADRAGFYDLHPGKFNDSDLLHDSLPPQNEMMVCMGLPVGSVYSMEACAATLCGLLRKRIQPFAPGMERRSV